jgi:hypothetical protein
MSRYSAAVLVLVIALLATTTPAAACDPEWDWCGWDSWDVPVYDEPVWSPPAWEPAPFYEPEPVAPAPWYEPPVYDAWEPSAAIEPVAYMPPDIAPTYEVPTYEPVVFVAPAYEPPAYEPVAYVAPVYDPLPLALPAWTAWIDPGFDTTPAYVAPNKWEVAAEIGVHRVTDTYAGDTVATSGLTTTWGTTTTHQLVDTAARLIATVGTGEASGLESVLWNGRARRSDGSLVRGTVYENFVWNGEEWVHDKFVFFQDDSETAALPLEPVLATPIPVLPSPRAVPPPVSAPAASPWLPGASAAPALPIAAEPEGPAWSAPVVPPPNAPAVAAPAPRRAVSAGIALGPQADALGRIEVLRGRAVRLWARALVDAVPGRVLSWTLASGDLTAFGPVQGAGDDPLTAAWEHVSVAGAPFAVTLDVVVDVPGEGPRDVVAVIDVVVRSPALVE